MTVKMHASLSCWTEDPGAILDTTQIKAVTQLSCFLPFVFKSIIYAESKRQTGSMVVQYRWTRLRLGDLVILGVCLWYGV